MAVPSTFWLGLGYFTYFFSFGIFLPFWSVWLKGENIEASMIGILLGVGLVARFIGSLIISSMVKDPSKLINSLRFLSLLSLLFAIGFVFGSHWAWLVFVMIGFNLFFSPLVPLSDALAGAWQKQFTFDYGKVRVWGSIAFIVSSSLTGILMSDNGINISIDSLNVDWNMQFASLNRWIGYDLFGTHHIILAFFVFSVTGMLLGMMLKPSIMPVGKIKTADTNLVSFKALLSEKSVWQFLVCVTLLQAAHAGYYSFGSIYWAKTGYSSSTIGYLWSLGVVAEVVVFTFSNQLFRRWSARNLLLLSGICSVIRWGLMGTSTELYVLIIIQILHCGTFTVCHLAAMRFIGARRENEIIRLQATYSALATGGGIAVMSMVAGFMYEHIDSGIFWVMALVALPALFLRPKVEAHSH
ncbi:putative 3-phenylpropionic acid transport protein (MFS family) [Xenorhabdus nematophila ATCC 19061]|uniref:3-phenylpropionic acid transport protein (MFS family) n=1 Tax=Xenorhabdus nematophila (strain ATCC 19061 / DSM 3370 / CCUG 14189 / LMG 1036 / NCIMB 9965 / AN6) TaxID=406817 RepID=D3VLL9_XENNA|nr:3-phenylpropionate MFS transporter [Xenorhabdus nematophila]CBJ91345.1 putative 3-phenylpropionic acid transport protein (MFS family) [Xenorhabdus nematophila ATCC 19061]CEK24165.1 putative 3-phenylpropionic acid transport protein (MFS family) [Xenorhabdus nematophila AN6/1]